MAFSHKHAQRETDSKNTYWKRKNLKNKEKQLHPEEVEENNTDKYTWKGPTKSEWFYKKNNETDKPQVKQIIKMKLRMYTSLRSYNHD